MSPPMPGTRPTGKLVWAPQGVMSRIAQEVTPRITLRRRVAFVATYALLFTWPPAFLVLAVATIAAPSATDDAGIGRVAFWALLFAALIAVVAVLRPLVPHVTARGTAETDDTDDAEEPSRSALGTLWRVAVQVLISATCASLVLASQGLSANQIATLAAALVVTLHLLPMLVFCFANS